jgi:hypothetical protein
MKRAASFLLALILLPVLAIGEDLPVKYFAATGGSWWNTSALTFWAPFTDPANPLTLNKGTGSLTFTRATTATYVHPTTGLITTASDNVLRIESNGALIEGARTNLILWSSALATPFSGYNPAGIDPSIDSDVAVSPDGSTTAERINFSAIGGTSNVIYSKFTSSATTYTFSVYLKVASGTVSVGIFLYSDIGPVGTGVICNLTTAWQRFSVTGNMPATADSFANIGYDIRNPPAGQAQVGTPSIIAWGTQLEQASFPSSYIPTVAAAVARNASVLTEQTSGNIDNVEGTLALTWTPRFASTDNVVTATLFDAAGVRATYTSADRKINFTDNTNTVSSAALTFSANVAQKLAFRWGSSGLLVYRNGAQAATGATYTATTLNANLYIGTNISSANAAYSNIGPVRTWNREFSAAEMGAITQ